MAKIINKEKLNQENKCKERMRSEIKNARSKMKIKSLIPKNSDGSSENKKPRI
jgi:hypothetical protein